MHRRRLAVPAVVLATALSLAACTGGGDDPPEPSASPSSASPSPTFEVQPVIGERIVNTSSLSTGINLGLDDDAIADEEAIATAVETVGDHLDAHLDALQRDGEGTLEEFAANGLLDEGDITSVTTDLASPRLPVQSAHYTITAYHDGAPEWITARVEVTRVDDSVALATMTFYMTQRGQPLLTMFGPEEPHVEEGA